MSRMVHYTSRSLYAGNHRVSVALVGVGGTGSAMLSHLVQLDQAMKAHDLTGLHVTVFDEDTVSESNIGRQTFSTADIGHSKASVLVSRMNGYCGLDWKAVPFKFPCDCYNPMRPFDIVISCVDTGAARIGISKAVKASNASYWLDLGNTNNSGQVILGTNGEIDQPTDDNTTPPLKGSIYVAGKSLCRDSLLWCHTCSKNVISEL